MHSIAIHYFLSIGTQYWCVLVSVRSLSGTTEFQQRISQNLNSIKMFILLGWPCLPDSSPGIREVLNIRSH